MFLRTSDACPEFGFQPNEYWTPANIRACLAGAGIPTILERSALVRRDEAMQQLFALRRRSFAFQELQTMPTDYIEPTDFKSAPANRQGALIAADRLKLLFRSQGNLLPGSPLLREDAALAVTRFVEWEQQGGADKETNEILPINKDCSIFRPKEEGVTCHIQQIKEHDPKQYLKASHRQRLGPHFSQRHNQRTAPLSHRDVFS